MPSFQEVMEFFQQNDFWTLIWVLLTVFTVIASLYLLMRSGDSDEVVEVPRDIFAPIGAARSVSGSWSTLSGGAIVKLEQEAQAQVDESTDASGNTIAAVVAAAARYSTDLPDEDIVSADKYYVRAYGSDGLPIKVGTLSLSTDESKKLLFPLGDAGVDPAPAQIHVYKY